LDNQIEYFELAIKNTFVYTPVGDCVLTYPVQANDAPLLTLMGRYHHHPHAVVSKKTGPKNEWQWLLTG
jgi:hypothetical protein